MGAKYYQPKSPTHLKKCSERKSNACDPAETDGCCAVIACSYCLEFDPYGGPTVYGTAEFDVSGWRGTISGSVFFGFWDRRYFIPPLPPSLSNSIGMVFNRIPSGTYLMGSPVSEPGRGSDEDQITQDIPVEFAMGKHQVTQKQYFDVMGARPSHFSFDGFPVEKVSFEDALTFCSRLNAIPAELEAGRTYRLPYENEWEYACRAGTTTAYSFGNDPLDLDANGWYVLNSLSTTHGVGEKIQNTWGLTDMHGNVWEWCRSSVASTPPGSQAIRGGGWNSVASDCRSANRDTVTTTTVRNDIGFRVIMEQSPDSECEFVATIDDEEVYRKSCYEGQSCRDSSDETTATINYDSGTLRWIKRLHRPLERIIDPETNCRTQFCGNCECTCRCLCISIRDAVTIEGVTHTSSGEICDSLYTDCDAPVWYGVVTNPLAETSYDFDLTLERDVYGECVLTGTIGGESIGQVTVSDCNAINFEFTSYAGVVFGFRCKVCESDDCAESNLCCDRRNLSGPLNLNVLNSLTTCGSPQGVFSIPADGSPAGPFSVLVPVPDGGEDVCVAVDFTFRLLCDPGGPVYQLEMKFEYLGTTYPATGWYTQFKVSEDCGPPYIGLWDQRGDGAFWNGVLSFLLEE